jgi:hypothetical protein
LFFVLYLDGVISALWAPDAGREEDLSERGPFAGIITAHPISLAPRERGEGRGEGPK